MGSADTKPWERQDTEPEIAYEAFKGYCFQTPPRRMQHASVKHGMAEVSALYNEWNWKERALAWDRHMDRIRVEQRENLLKQDEKDRLEKMMVVLETTGEVLSREMAKLLRESEKSTMSGLVKPADLIKMSTMWITMQRLIHGQSTENVNVQDERLEKLSLDELRELQRIQAKMAEGEGDDEPPRH